MGECRHVLLDVLARLVRALEGLEDGDRELVAAVLADLCADLWVVIEQLEPEERCGR